MKTLVTGEVLRHLDFVPCLDHRRSEAPPSSWLDHADYLCFPIAFLAEEGSEPKSTRMTCGSCPEGYAMTGVTSDAKICKDGDPTWCNACRRSAIFSRYAALVRMAIVKSAVPQTRLGVATQMGGV